MKKIQLLFVLFSFCMLTPTAGQTIDKARALYRQEKYQEAKPMFESLLQAAPNNANYNFWYGVCALHTGEAHKAVKPLELANKRRVPDAAYHLGKAYLANYQFEEAVKVLEGHIKTQQRRRKDTRELEQLLKQSKLSQRMIKGVEQVTVIDSLVVDKKDFLTHFKLSEESGHLGYLPESPADSLAYRPILYQTERGNKRYISQPNAAGFYELYAQTKLGDEWSKKKALVELNKDSVDTNFPFMLSDGMTLYYASNDPNLLGGYDILVTRYNTNTDAYLVPENVGMPFNSFYNDYMYCIDEFNNLGWFASDRFQPQDKLCIYIFIPNKVKRTYDFETTPKETLQKLASLQDIKLTWQDEAVVKEGLKRLNYALNYQPQQDKKDDFVFVINDQFVYTSINDFTSMDAKQAFYEYQLSSKQLNSLEQKLADLRLQYEQGNKEQLSSAILDLEKTVANLRLEIEKQEKHIRALELKK